jgi:uncharacterized protein
MVDIRVTDDSVDPTGATLVEGMPGVGLVGKLATDHLIDALDMTQFASVRGEGIPPITIFDEDDRGVNSPIRLFADPDESVLALRSDVPVHVMDAPLFAENLTQWLADHDVLPIYLGGLPTEREGDDVPTVQGLGVGDGRGMLEDADVATPDSGGMISGPCGALLSEAADVGLDAVGLMVDTDPRFPDPQGAHALVDHGINPLAGLDVGTDRLVEEAEQIMDQREELAKQMQQADQHESSQASRTGMFQ